MGREDIVRPGRFREGDDPRGTPGVGAEADALVVDVGEAVGSSGKGPLDQFIVDAAEPRSGIVGGSGQGLPDLVSRELGAQSRGRVVAEGVSGGNSRRGEKPSVLSAQFFRWP
jgi:hypothetical protein